MPPRRPFSKRPWFLPTIVFFTLQLLLIVIPPVVINYFPLRTGYLGGGTATFLTQPYLWARANFDGVHYLSIAQNGYAGFQQAFFPLYPLLIRSLFSLTHLPFIWSGLFISYLSLVVSLICLYKLICQLSDETIAQHTLVLLLLFPTSFFLFSIYTESLFLALGLGAVWAATNKRWYIAGFLGALAAATRVIGIFLIVPILWEWIKTYQKEKPNLTSSTAFGLGGVLLVGLGLVAYMVYLAKTTGDPLYFFTSQPAFGANRSGSSLILLPQVIWRYGKIFATASRTTIEYYVAVLEFSTLAAGALLIWQGFVQRWVPRSWLVYSAAILLLPTLTGTLSSLPRYLLTAFPIYILTCRAITNRPSWVKWTVFTLSLGLWSILYSAFTLGYFVA